MSDKRYRIGELVTLTGLTPDALRFYERQGVLDERTRSARHDPGSSGIIRDDPGMRLARGQQLRGIGRHNCGARLLIHESPFKRRFLGVFGCGRAGARSSSSPPVETAADTVGAAIESETARLETETRGLVADAEAALDDARPAIDELDDEDAAGLRADVEAVESSLAAVESDLQAEAYADANQGARSALSAARDIGSSPNGARIAPVSCSATGSTRAPKTRRPCAAWWPSARPSWSSSTL